MHVYGHRGAAGEAPENTIAGCLHAIERGARHVEIDLRLSADDQLVVIHDKTLRRMTGNWRKVGNYKASELAAMDARADGPPWPQKKDCGIPTLEALLEATTELEKYQLEVKADSKETAKRMAYHLAEQFDTPEAARKIVVTSSDHYLHSCLADIAPHIKRGLVMTLPRSLSKPKELGCDYVAIHWSVCNPIIIRELKKAGLHISVWTVNDAQFIKTLYKMKIDSVITDYPSMAIPLVASLQR